MKKRFVAYLLMLEAIWACTASSQPHVVLFPEKGAPVTVRVEIANTEEKRALGLMYRRELPESQGMLFLFPQPKAQSFWMKNTPLSLDIIFIDTSRTIIAIAANTTPFSEKLISSGKPAQFVLEVNAGFCQRHGIMVGNRVQLPGE